MSELENQKIRAEIQKLEAEAESLSKGNNSLLKTWTPLILSALALFGGWTQYTKNSVEDRERSVEARESILKSEEEIELKRAEIDNLVVKLAEVKGQLESNTLALAKAATDAGADQGTIKALTDSSSSKLTVLERLLGSGSEIRPLEVKPIKIKPIKMEMVEPLEIKPLPVEGLK